MSWVSLLHKALHSFVTCQFTRRTARPGMQGLWMAVDSTGAGRGCGCRQRVYPARVGGHVEARGPGPSHLRPGQSGGGRGEGAAGQGGPGSGSSEVRWRAGRAPRARRRRFWLPLPAMERLTLPPGGAAAVDEYLEYRR